MATGTPRDLDPKFKTEKSIPESENRPETVTSESDPRPQVENQNDLKSDALLREEDRVEAEEKYDDDTPMIVHRQRITNPDGTVGEKVHGPMPVADWPAYEKENGL